jgi:hypothetical protein
MISRDVPQQAHLQEQGVVPGGVDTVGAVGQPPGTRIGQYGDGGVHVSVGSAGA